MGSEEGPSLALIIQSGPYQSRVARDGIDFALAAAAMEMELRVYFPGQAVMQLARDRSCGHALLPGGYRAWSALPELSPARIFAERSWLDFFQSKGVEWVMPVEALSGPALKQSWRACDHAVVL